MNQSRKGGHNITICFSHSEKLPILFSFLSSLFAGKSHGGERREERRTKREEGKVQKEKAADAIISFWRRRRDSLSPAGSVRARENDPPDRFLTRAQFDSPDLVAKRKAGLSGRVFLLSSGYEKDGFAGLTDGFEPSKVFSDISRFARCDIFFKEKCDIFR